MRGWRAHPAGRQAPGRNRTDLMTAVHVAGREARKQSEISHEQRGKQCVSISRGARNHGRPITWRPGLSPLTPSRAGARCATASSYLTTAANCSPTAAPSHLTGPPRPSRWQWPPEVAMTLITPWTKARRAQENRVYVRELLWKRESAFAAELATAEQDFPCCLPMRATGDSRAPRRPDCALGRGPRHPAATRPGPRRRQR